ncbi:MAG: TrbC/VirB2 family protein, partial [Aestuariivirga sp.]
MRPVRILVLAGVSLVVLQTNLALAAGSGMPWEAPLTQILESVEGPVARIVAVIIIIVTGLSLAFGDTSGGFRRLIQIVFGLSIAFAATSFFGSGPAALARGVDCLDCWSCHCRNCRTERRPVCRCDLPTCPSSGEPLMLNLTEYRKRPKLLSDYLPWGFLVGPGIVLNKDGSFLRLAHYRGPEYTLSFCWLPPAETQDKAGAYLVDRGDDARTTTDTRGYEWRDFFITETDRALDLLGNILSEVRFLDDGETLTYLHGTVSFKDHAVAVPPIPAYLDAMLADTPFMGGMAPKLGEHHLRSVSVLGLPGVTTPGLLDELNDLAIPYRWVTRWIAVDRPEAQRLLTRKRRQWFAKRKSVAAILREVLFNQETALLDTDAATKANETNEALEDLGSGDVAFGYVTTTITVANHDESEADEALRQVERVVNGKGFVTIRETFNAVEAWLGSLPGNPYANVRQPIVHTLNLAHIMPVSSVWAGPAWNEHLDQPPLLHAATRGSTPFRLNLHVGDVGHALIVGPTGAGKSVLLALIALQFRRYEDAQVFIFDKGRSARAAALTMGGTAIDLGLGSALAFQPLRDIDDAASRAFARDWVLGLIAHEGVVPDPSMRDAIWTALNSLASAPPSERTLTGLSLLLQSNPLRQALQPYTLEG